MNYSISKIPKLKHSNGHIEAKQEERFKITIADTSLSPDTVMIHFILAFATGTTVMNSWKFVIFANGAIVMGGGVRVIKEFL